MGKAVSIAPPLPITSPPIVGVSDDHNINHANWLAEQARRKVESEMIEAVYRPRLSSPSRRRGPDELDMAVAFGLGSLL